jgi:uncharacterized DUF497 family protein
MEFAWDERKASANLLKHAVSFEEAVTAFYDPLSSTIADPDQTSEDLRFLLIGLSSRGRLLVIAHADFGDQIRIISARLATRRERWTYEETQ